MRTIAALLATAVAVCAQNTLTTTFANNNGGAVGGAIYYDLAAGVNDVLVSSIDANFGGAGGVAGTLDVYTTPTTSVGNELTAANWTLVESIAVTTVAVGSPTSATLSSALTIPAGTSIGVCLVANGMAHAYTTGTAPFPLVYDSCGLTLTANAASNTPFTGTLFLPRVPNLEIGYASTGNCASVVPQGVGCTTTYASFYELLPPGPHDLMGKIVTGVSKGGVPNSGYDVTVSPSPAFFSPGPSAVALPLSDDSQVTAGTLGVTVGSNCWIALGAGNSNAFTPDIATFLSNPFDTIAAWTDLEPNAIGSGEVWYEESGTVATVTYDGVYGWGTVTPTTVQFVYDTATGNFSIEIDAIGASNPEPMLVGFSPGGGSADPQATDISAASVDPIETTSVDEVPLTLTAIGRPIDGAVPSDFEVTTSNFGPGALLHLGFLGLSRPGVPLSLVGFGPGDCVLHASFDETIGPVSVVGGGGAPVTWTALSLPGASGLFNGFQFNVQAATLDATVVGPGGRVSNGLKCVVGDG